MNVSTFHRSFLIILAVIGYSVNAYSQDFIMNPTPVNSCSGNFFDSGGSFNRYSNNENIVKTICPAGTIGTHIELQFLNTDLGPGDNLCVYDGTSIAAPQILCTLDDTNPTSGAYTVAASAPNASGCLTLQFTSDAAGNGEGWEALITCVPACQRIIAEVVSTTPAAEPLDNGWIDICPGDFVNFVARGNYPQNGFTYFQSDANSTFTWDFGDGTIGFGTNVNHTYQRSGGYTVQLSIEDSQGCTNNNVISQRVRVATAPNYSFDAGFPTQVCAEDTLVFLNNIEQSNSNIQVFPNEGQFSVTSGNVDSIPLPDGTNVAYRSPVTFTEFIPGAVITNVNQIKSICINIEHSYLRDLDISLECPDGKVMRLDTTNADFTLEMFLGIPEESDDDLSGTPLPGIGFTYCFTPTPQYGTFFDQALSLFSSQGARTSLPEGTYTPIDGFNTLVTCPVNGEWTLVVEDKLTRDNGWLFSWDICFSDDLRPPVETFTPGIVDWGFIDNSTMIHNDRDSMVAIPTSAGTTNYIFQVTDEFGCTFDTTLSFSVVAPTDPSCFQCDEVVGNAADVGICENEDVQLMVEYLGFDESTIPFENNTEVEFGNATNPPPTPLESTIAVAGASPAVITNTMTDIASICIDIDTDATGDLQIHLESPSGEILELSTNNGGGGDNFRNTCFINDPLLQNITAASPPYTGNFLPEGDWSDLNGSQVNGRWILRLSDALGPLDINVLRSWSISFNVENEPVYSWSPTSGLSCSNCPDPVASPTTTTEYIVTVSDDFGCVGFDTILVSVVPELDAPVVSLDEPAPGVLVFEWAEIIDATGYEINVNGGGWFPPNNGDLSHFLTGLAEGDPIEFCVRGITDLGMCNREETCIDLIFGECLSVATPVVLFEIDCFGADNAQILANVSGATLPVSYTLDGLITQEGLSIFNNVSSGMHNIIVEDGDGCRDTVFFDLEEPAEIVLDAMGVDVSCVGANDGELIASATGGVGSLSYLWATVPSTFEPIATGQGAGTYTIQVFDENNCEVTDQVTISEPDPIMITLLGDEPSCNGGTDGSIISTVTGGTMPYNYEWDIPAFTADVMVGAGEHTVTVTDANLCEASRSIQITEPAPGTATAIGMDASCHNTTDGSATIDTTGLFTYLWDDPDMQTTQTAINLAPGVYNFTITDVDGCNSIGFVGIGAPSEVQAATFSTITSCFGGDDGTATVAVAGGVGPYSFLWNDPASQTDSIAVGLIAGDYEVIITDGRGCSTSRMETVGSATEITIEVDSTFASCIENADGSASAFPTGGTGTYTFLWDDDMGQTSSTANDLEVGIYTVTVTDTNNCSVTNSVEVIAGDPVRIDSIVGTMPSCFGENDGEIVGFISGGEAPYDYLWDDAVAQFFNPATMLVAGDYSLTVTDVNGCTAVGGISLSEPDLLEIELSAQDIDCFGADNGIITAEISGGTYPYDYLIDSDMVNDSIIENLTAGMYTVEVVDRNECTANTQIEIIEPAEALSFEIIQVDTSCAGAGMNSAMITANGGTGPNYAYNWSAPNNMDSPSLSNLAAGMLFVTVTDENMCTIEDSILIQEYDPLDSILLITREPSCTGFPDGLIAVTRVRGGAGQGIIDNYTYDWQDYPDEDSEILNNVPGGEYYMVTITDAQGCTAVASDSIGQPQQIKLTINKENPTCFGDTDGFIDIFEVTGDNPVASYEWSISTIDDQQSRLENLADDTYFVTVTDSEGCSVVTFVNVNEPDTLTNMLNAVNNICDGDTNGQITASPKGGTVPYNFNWSNTETTQTINNLPVGDYVVTVTDDNGCSLIDSISIIAPPAIQVDAEVTNITCFEGSDGSIVLNTSGGQAPYEYNFDGEFFTNQNVRNGLETGAYPVIIMDSQGCTWDSIVQIGTVPQFQLFAGEDRFINIGDSVTLDVTLFNAVGQPEIIWSSITDFDLSCTECQSTIVSPINTAIYEAYGIDENGCEANDFVQVFVAEIAQIMVPTGFTPNNDGNNDILVVHGKAKNIIGINSFTIYDRWGEAVYERRNFDVNDRSIGWDGTFRGQEMEAGTYIWTLQVRFENGDTDNFQGATTLIR